MPERVLAPVSHSADSHCADGFVSCSSADSHRADDVSPDTMLAVSSYNVSKQGLEALCVCVTVVVEVVEPGLPPAHSMPVRGNFGSSIWLHNFRRTEGTLLRARRHLGTMPRWTRTTPHLTMAMASTHQEEAEQINMVNPTVNTRSNEDFDDGDGKVHLNNMMLAASKDSGEGEDETAISLPGNCKALSLKMQPAHPIYEMAEAVATSNSKRRWQWPLT